MAARRPRNSTTVRSAITLAAIRAGFRLGSWLAPGHTVERSARLFTRPLPSSRRRAMATPSLDAVESDLVVDGIRLHVYAWGDPATQPYVLLAHGWSSHATRFGRWIQPLRDAGYAVVAFDQAGHGRSGGSHTTLPDFACHLLAVGRRYGRAAMVLGHSLGAGAAAIALSGGLAADRAMLIAPPADPLAAVQRFARLVGLADGLAREMFATFERRMRFDVADLQAPTIAPGLGMPALVVHDLGDREVPWGEGECYARHWPGARLLSTSGLGHNRVVDDPAVIDAGLRFLRGETVGDRVVSTPAMQFGFA